MKVVGHETDQSRFSCGQRTREQIRTIAELRRACSTFVRVSVDTEAPSVNVLERRFVTLCKSGTSPSVGRFPRFLPFFFPLTPHERKKIYLCNRLQNFFWPLRC